MAPTIYLLLKWLHVMLAIAALGANFTYGFWIGRAARHPDHLAYVLRTVTFIDVRITAPSYALLLLTGLGMAFVPSGPALNTPWLLVSIVLYVVALALSFGMYAPVLRRQLRAAEQSGPESQEYRVAAAQGRQLGAIVAVILVVIVFLMVTKPGFGLPAPVVPLPAHL